MLAALVAVIVAVIVANLALRVQRVQVAPLRAAALQAQRVQVLQVQRVQVLLRVVHYTPLLLELILEQKLLIFQQFLMI